MHLRVHYLTHNNAGILFGDYLIAKHNWMGLRDEEEKEEESWASQFEIKGDTVEELDQNQND